ncbi:hypothetical protein A33Q_4146 [Indibacter alkaliphilus LW1]|jgi:hypothetical protein|uniref:Uncharacterized protein n=1 Tax=Indibacter alkaliphilus (strain CCUG 57479 / KCTC 22604 / LW1) TaxID=1189612 RepID=S2DQF9_INDAL|nr:hypothetical protein A33Q_4146 [Indibacter alkaliphilus LW1]
MTQKNKETVFRQIISNFKDKPLAFGKLKVLLSESPSIIRNTASKKVPYYN